MRLSAPRETYACRTPAQPLSYIVFATLSACPQIPHLSPLSQDDSTTLPYTPPPRWRSPSPTIIQRYEHRPNKRSSLRNVLKGANRIWPQAQVLLDRLTAAEATASRHSIQGPAASENAWPLDGPFVGFQRTPANEDAYYMHVAIRRAAAAVRTRAEEEMREQEEEDREKKRKAAAGRSGGSGDVDGGGGGGGGGLRRPARPGWPQR